MIAIKAIKATLNGKYYRLVFSSCWEQYTRPMPRFCSNAVQQSLFNTIILIILFVKMLK